MYSYPYQKISHRKKKLRKSELFVCKRCQEYLLYDPIEHSGCVCDRKDNICCSCKFFFCVCLPTFREATIFYSNQCIRWKHWHYIVFNEIRDDIPLPKVLVDIISRYL